MVVVVVRPRVASGASAAWWWWSWWQSWPIHNDQQQGGRRCVIITKIIKTIESLIEIYFPLSLFYRSVGRWVGSNTSDHSVPRSTPRVMHILDRHNVQCWGCGLTERRRGSRRGGGEGGWKPEWSFCGQDGTEWNGMVHGLQTEAS